MCSNSLLSTSCIYNPGLKKEVSQTALECHGSYIWFIYGIPSIKKKWLQCPTVGASKSNLIWSSTNTKFSVISGKCMHTGQHPSSSKYFLKLYLFSLDEFIEIITQFYTHPCQINYDNNPISRC